MKNPVNIGYKGLDNLEIGDIVRYIAGQGDHHMEAVAEVAKPSGGTGCIVRIIFIEQCGSKVTHKKDDEICAGALELFYKL